MSFESLALTNFYNLQDTRDTTSTTAAVLMLAA